jgi:hypothetical protein
LHAISSTPEHRLQSWVIAHSIVPTSLKFAFRQVLIATSLKILY